MAVTLKFDAVVQSLLPSAADVVAQPNSGVRQTSSCVSPHQFWYSARRTVLAADAVVLDTDTGVGVQWSETSSADDFSKNLIRALCEGRFGTSVLNPLGVVSCDLTA